MYKGGHTHEEERMLERWDDGVDGTQEETIWYACAGIQHTYGEKRVWERWDCSLDGTQDYTIRCVRDEVASHAWGLTGGVKQWNYGMDSKQE